jgi:hypothetical protein
LQIVARDAAAALDTAGPLERLLHIHVLLAAVPGQDVFQLQHDDGHDPLHRGDAGGDRYVHGTGLRIPPSGRVTDSKSTWNPQTCSWTLARAPHRKCWASRV